MTEKTFKNQNLDYDIFVYGEQDYIGGQFEDSFLDYILNGFGKLENSHEIKSSSVDDICNLLGVSDEYKAAILDELEGKDADSPVVMSVYENILYIGFFTCICEEWGSNAVAFYAPCKIKET